VNHQRVPINVESDFVRRCKLLTERILSIIVGLNTNKIANKN
jgi:hypothetical protein